MTWRVILTLLLSTIVPRAMSQESGAVLYEMCSLQRGPAGETGCMAYTVGVAAGLVIGQTLSSLGHRFCPPKDLNGAQTRIIVEEYMRSHRERLNEPPARVVALALLSAFPCQKED